jgi:ankyrin repeat domain-containing protein 42
LAFPAHVAAYNGDFEHVRLLVEQGVVNINERDEHGSTLAHKAAGQGHLAILQWLIENGATLDLTSQSGETPKDVARRFGQLACLKILGGGAEKGDGSQVGPMTDAKRRSEQRRSTPKEEERGRAKIKLDDLLKQLDIAKKNFRQLGGHLDEDAEREAREQETQKYETDHCMIDGTSAAFVLGHSMSMMRSWKSND